MKLTIRVFVSWVDLSSFLKMSQTRNVLLNFMRFEGVLLPDTDSWKPQPVNFPLAPSIPITSSLGLNEFNLKLESQ